MKSKFFAVILVATAIPSQIFAQSIKIPEAEYNIIAECTGVLHYTISNKSESERRATKEQKYIDALFARMMKASSAIKALDRFNLEKGIAAKKMPSLGANDRDKMIKSCMTIGARALDTKWSL
jgi:hypothetical protein